MGILFKIIVKPIATFWTGRNSPFSRYRGCIVAPRVSSFSLVPSLITGSHCVTLAFRTRAPLPHRFKWAINGSRVGVARHSMAQAHLQLIRSGDCLVFRVLTALRPPSCLSSLLRCVFWLPCSPSCGVPRPRKWRRYPQLLTLSLGCPPPRRSCPSYPPPRLLASATWPPTVLPPISPFQPCRALLAPLRPPPCGGVPAAHSSSYLCFYCALCAPS